MDPTETPRLEVRFSHSEIRIVIVEFRAARTMVVKTGARAARSSFGIIEKVINIRGKLSTRVY